jgi:periplasmic copper chaperone A
MTIRRIALTLLAAVGLVGLSAGVAAAHVTVNSPGATQGGYAVLSFRVPTESETASTTGLRVQLPTDTPIASVSVEAKPGWNYTVTKTELNPPVQTDDGAVTEAVGEIAWTAVGDGVKPGEFAEFRVSAGPLPKQASITFKVIQRYSDGTEVGWVEVPAPGSTAELQHPAPTLNLAPATGAAATAPATGSASATATSTATASAEAAATATAHEHPDDDYASQSGVTTALVTSAVAVLLAGIGCALAFVAWRRTHP